MFVYIDFAEILKKIDRINSSFKWTRGYNLLQEQLKNGNLEQDRFNLLIVDIKYYYARYIEFLSAALHKNLLPDVMFSLSSDFVQALNIGLDKIPDPYLNVTPGIESISNHMLMTAETDNYSFFASLYSLQNLIFGEKEFTQSISKQDKQLNKFFEVLSRNMQTIEHIKPFLKPVSDGEITRILNNNYTLCETIDYWCEEILKRYNASMIPAVMLQTIY
jgi:hypothetical protein